MATHKGIRTHQYLDDWLVRAGSHRVCLQHTQELVKTCQKLGWLVNLDKLKLEPKQIFDFVGYQFDLKAGRVRPTPDRWQNLQEKNTEEVDTFRRILSLPDPRESMSRSSTSVMGLDYEKGDQELRPRGPSSVLPLSSVIKDVFDKFEHDFKAANLLEGKYIKPPPSTTKWYKVEQPCYEEKIQELNTHFSTQSSHMP